MKQRIYFRADAGREIGYGHFIRTLALADMLKDDFDCVFVTQSPTAYQQAEVSGVCPLVGLPATDARLGMFLNMLEGDEIVVLDNYFYDTDYQRAIKAKGCKLVCIDDMHDKHYVADVVINHALSESILFSKEVYTHLCLGPSWALLRKPFLENALFVQKNRLKASGVERVTVCFGGVDVFRLTERVSAILAKIPGIKYIDCIDSLHRRDARGIADSLMAADMAFVSASTVCMEAFACGVPVAAGYYVDNQIGVYEEYKRRGYIIPLGNLLDRELEQRVKSAVVGKSPVNVYVGDVARKYVNLFGSITQSNNFYLNGLAFVDYTSLAVSYHKEIWKWRNDERIACWMDNSRPFSFDNHLAFVDRLKGNTSRIYWGVFRGTDFIASVNIEYFQIDTVSSVSSIVERGIFVVPGMTGTGIAGEVDRLLDEILRKKKVDIVQAKVKKDNSRSIRFHLKNHYYRLEEDADYFYFRKYIS